METIWEFEEKYGRLMQLFNEFLLAAEEDVFDEETIIERYFRNPYYTKDGMIEEAKRALVQAEEVLKLEPFPEDLIGDLTNRWHAVRTRKEWLEDVVEKLRVKIEEWRRKE